MMKVLEYGGAMGAAKIYFIIFGVLTIAGGVIGYVKAGSVPSIIAGAISGILLLVAAFLPSLIARCRPGRGTDHIVASGRPIHSQVYPHRKSDARRHDVDLERDRHHHGNRGLDEKVTARGNISCEDVAASGLVFVGGDFCRHYLPLDFARTLAALRPRGNIGNTDA